MTYWMNPFLYFPMRREEYFLQNITNFLHILALCVDVVDLAVLRGNYVGNILVLTPRSIEWIFGPHIFRSPNLK